MDVCSSLSKSKPFLDACFANPSDPSPAESNLVHPFEPEGFLLGLGSKSLISSCIECFLWLSIHPNFSGSLKWFDGTSILTISLGHAGPCWPYKMPCFHIVDMFSHKKVCVTPESSPGKKENRVTAKTAQRQPSFLLRKWCIWALPFDPSATVSRESSRKMQTRTVLIAFKTTHKMTFSSSGIVWTNWQIIWQTRFIGPFTLEVSGSSPQRLQS